MKNLMTWIEKVAEGHALEAIVIGEMGWGEYGSDRVPNYADIPKGKVLTWEEAAKWLDYDFAEGHGAPGCNAVYAWTATKVIFVWQYDGAVCVDALPRNPTAGMPEMPGG